MLSSPTPWMIADELSPRDQELRRQLNASVQRLADLRPIKVSAIDDDLSLSKVAWKVKSLIAALLHRIVALCDGAALSMNAKSPLGSALAVRALIETLAVLGFVREQLQKAVADRNIHEIDRLAFTWLMATRDPSRLSEFPAAKAMNIVTVLEKLAKTSELQKMAKEQYEILSEICHPNSAGGFFMFGDLDRANGTVTFSSEQNAALNVEVLHCALMLVMFVEEWIGDVRVLIPEVAVLDLAETPP